MRGRRARALVVQERQDLASIQGLGALVAEGEGADYVLLATASELTHLLGLVDCRFEQAPSDERILPVVHRDGSMRWGQTPWESERWGFPSDGVSIPVWSHGHRRGRFVLIAPIGLPVADAQLVKAVALVDQAGAALADVRGCRMSGRRRGGPSPPRSDTRGRRLEPPEPRAHRTPAWPIPPDSLGYRLKRKLLGPPLHSDEIEHQRLGKPTALAVFASDNLSSSAYATEEILHVLIPLVGVAAFSLVVPITLAMIVVLGFLILSYRETIKEYPSAGGAYLVTRDNFGIIPAQVAGASLLTDYILTVAVSSAAGTAALASAFEGLAPIQGADRRASSSR